ncbi:hypothetical protein EON65_24455 [archaeon]|nr:MAG: hypothetical protein EON65_24455 [archaeon]
MLDQDKAKLQEKLMHSEADNRSFKYQVESLQRQIEAHIEDKERIQLEAQKMMSKFREEELVATIENMRQTFKHQLQIEKTRHGEDMSKLRRVIDEKDSGIDKLQKELEKNIVERNQIFRQLEEARFRRPQADNSSQTQVTEAGLWDQQDGWILPISSTILARNRWRKVINLARCPSCKGNSRFVAQAAALFKKVTTGTAPVGLLEDDTITAETRMKWVIPDNLTTFLTNLPKTVQGWNPHNLAWTVKTTYLLLDFRSIVDEEDRKLGYRIENFMDYTIETFLRTVDNRSQAELNLYQYVRSLREHHANHHLLHLAARCLHLSAALSKEEAQKALDLRTRGEMALKRKREAQMRGLKYREKLKVLADKERESEDNVTVQAQESAYEKEFGIREDILSKEILAAVLFVRKCLYAEPYRGVYKKAIWQVKETCRGYTEFENSLAKTKEKLWPPGSPAVYIPSHVIFNAQDKFQTYLPADRVVRVLRPLLSSCDPTEVLGIYRAMESHCMILNSDGKICMPDGMHSFIRSTLRLYIYAESPDGADIETWQGLKDKYNHHVDSLQKYRHGSESKHKREITLHEDTEKYTLIVDIDYVLLLVSEIWRRKAEQVDTDLKRTFEIGDVNKDNVLSYAEFRTIVQRVYKGCEERKILRMFREALLLGMIRLLFDHN